MRSWVVAVPALLLLLAPVTVTAQVPPMATPPIAPSAPGTTDAEIVVTGQATVRVPPSVAVVGLQVDVRARTAADAGAENARRVQVVLDSLRAHGLADSLVATARYIVQPAWRSDPHGRHGARADGYLAQNHIQVTVRTLGQLGPLIDAALAAGATQVSGIRFHADDEARLQLRALDAAVRQARERASVMAHAAGGTLGRLRQLTTERDGPLPGIQGVLQLQAGPATMPTTIMAGDIAVTVTVLGRWALGPQPTGAATGAPP